MKRKRGGWFNIKMTSYQYRKSHCGDKTILRPSYLHNGISYTGTSLCWIRVEVRKFLNIQSTAADNPTPFFFVLQVQVIAKSHCSHNKITWRFIVKQKANPANTQRDKPVIITSKRQSGHFRFWHSIGTFSIRHHEKLVRLHRKNVQSCQS